MLATLVAVSGVVLIALSARLSLLRRVLTPTVTGTVIMLLPVTVMPILFDMLNRTLPGASAAAGPVSALVTIAVIIGIGLKGTGTLRIWAPLVGVARGVPRRRLVRHLRHRAGGQRPRGSVSRRAGGPASTSISARRSGRCFRASSSSPWSCATRVDRRRRRRSACVLAPAPGGGFPGGAGCGGRGRRRQTCWRVLAGTTPSAPYPVSVSLTELTGVAARRVGVATRCERHRPGLSAQGARPDPRNSRPGRREPPSWW